MYGTLKQILLRAATSVKQTCFQQTLKACITVQ